MRKCIRIRRPRREIPSKGEGKQPYTNSSEDDWDPAWQRLP
jgi:hypothetical protein